MSKYGKLIAIGATTLLAAAGTLSAGIFMSSARESSMAMFCRQIGKVRKARKVGAKKQPRNRTISPEEQR